MSDIAEFIHYTTIALTVGMSSIGVGIGAGLMNIGAFQAIDEQPAAQSDVLKLIFLSTALIDTAAIMGVVVAMMLLFDAPEQITIYSGIAELGILFAICLPGLCIGLFSSLPARQACLSLARQPFFAQKILRFTLVSLSIIQTPIIFGFLIALLIKSHMYSLTTYAQGMQLLASGLCIGLGSIGPSCGMAFFARAACKGIGINRNIYNQLFSFTIVSEAIIETPVIFAVVVSLIVAAQSGDITFLKGVALISAALCTGLGTLGPGISSGQTAAAACDEIAEKPSAYSSISRMSMFAQGLIDTSVIYSFIMSIALIWWT
jgi:F0F1-type ATP synthase membrane subunit c/vacuolar-type H+-ATPase subunit K